MPSQWALGITLSLLVLLPALGFQAHVDTPGFSMSAADLSSGLHACDVLYGLSKVHLSITFMWARSRLTEDVLFDLQR